MEIIQVGFNMKLYNDIEDSSSSFRGSSSSNISVMGRIEQNKLAFGNGLTFYGKSSFTNRLETPFGIV